MDDETPPPWFTEWKNNNDTVPAWFTQWNSNTFVPFAQAVERRFDNIQGSMDALSATLVQRQGTVPKPAQREDAWFDYQIVRTVEDRIRILCGWYYSRVTIAEMYRAFTLAVLNEEAPVGDWRMDPVTEVVPFTEAIKQLFPHFPGDSKNQVAFLERLSVFAQLKCGAVFPFVNLQVDDMELSMRTDLEEWTNALKLAGTSLLPFYRRN